MVRGLIGLQDGGGSFLLRLRVDWNFGGLLARPVKHPYEQLEEVALLELTNKPLEDAIAASLNLTEIWKVLRNARPHRSSAWETESSVGTAIDTVKRQRGIDEEEPTTATEWLAQVLARQVEEIYLRLRSSPEAAEPLQELLREQQNDPRSWPDDRVAAAARQTFLNALVAEDRETRVRRVNLLHLRAHENSNLALSELTETDTELGNQVEAYWSLWDQLIKAYGRRLVPGLDTPELIEMLGVLEEGFLGQAVGMSKERIDDFADRFARSVIAMVAGATEEN